MVYTATNGSKWYLHTKEIILPRNKVKGTTYFFSKKIQDGYYKSDLPVKYTVIETHSGLPMVKKA